jgi:hypothetical protein
MRWPPKSFAQTLHVAFAFSRNLNGVGRPFLGQCILTRQRDCNAEQGVSQFISNSLLQSRSHACSRWRGLDLDQTIDARRVHALGLGILLELQAMGLRS